MLKSLTLCLLALGLIPQSSIGNEMTFYRAHTGGNCNGCEWVAAEGEITENTPARFKEFLKDTGSVYLLVLNSDGGSLSGGIELGRLIRDSGATTTVGKTVGSLFDLGGVTRMHHSTEPGVCASACAFAFMGGLERWVHKGNLLGVHQFYSPKQEDFDIGVTQQVVGLTLLHVLEMGIDPQVIVAASNTPADQIHWFTEWELASFGLDTKAYYSDPWRIEPYKAGLIIHTRFHESVRRSVDITLFCRLSNGLWHVLISEDAAFWASSYSDQEIINVTEGRRFFPVLSIGGLDFSIQEENIEFQRLSDSRYYLSISVPVDVVEHASERISFDPRLARVFDTFLSASATLPPQEWLDVVGRNCI